jgi:hypothetical protein
MIQAAFCCSLIDSVDKLHVGDDDGVVESRVVVAIVSARSSQADASGSARSSR